MNQTLRSGLKISIENGIKDGDAGTVLKGRGADITRQGLTCGN